MAKKESVPKSAPFDSREALLHAAKRVFALKGFEGATVKDLADAAGVNVSLVSYHFGGKENLYRTCLESFGISRVEAAERILRVPTSLEEFKLRLSLFAEDFIDIHIKDADTCKMIHRATEAMDAVTSDIFKSVFVRIFNSFHQFLESAQRAGWIRSEIDSQVAASLMFGALMNSLRSREIAKTLGHRTVDEPPYRALVIQHWVDSFLNGICAPPSEKK